MAAKKKKEKDAKTTSRKGRELRDGLVKDKITDVARAVHGTISRRGAPKLDFPARTLSNVVYGEKEASSGLLPVRMRTGEQKDLKLTELEDHARHLQGDLPPARLPIPVRMSLRPIFHG